MSAPQQILLATKPAAAGGADVDFDSKFEKASGSSTSPFAFVSNAGTVAGTVGANSNRVLIGYAVFRSVTTSAVTMTWNGVSMTSITGKITAAAGLFEMYLFGLVAPATGNQSLSVAWTGGASQVVLGAISAFNANQTTGWQNNGSDTGTGTSASSDTTSASGNMAVAGHCNNDATSTTIGTNNGNWVETSLSGNFAMGCRKSAGATTNITWTLGSSVAWGNVKLDVVKA